MRIPTHAESQILIGLTISVPTPYAQTLTRARVESGDADATAIPPHITLLPPTAVEREELRQVRDHLGRVAAAHRPFVVTLAGTSSFRPISPTVFVEPQQGAAECIRLHQAINRAQLSQPMRFPYRPHVTIAHDVDEDQLDAALAGYADFHATFPVAGFARFELCADGVWREVEVFPLSGSPDAR
ncbi:MAG: 2'-5' RNA ligase family protein [Beutenbergiaceae bacterium]